MGSKLLMAPLLLLVAAGAFVDVGWYFAAGGACAAFGWVLYVLHLFGKERDDDRGSMEG